MENKLNIILKNYVNNVEGIIAVAIFDKDGLLIASEHKEGTGSDSDAIMGAISSMIDSSIDRIKKEFNTEVGFFNITSTGDKKFAFCSKGQNSILTTLAQPNTSDVELKVFSEHIAIKIDLLLDRNENISLEIPDIIKLLSKTRSGKFPEGDFATKLVLIGDYRAGKSSLIRRFVHQKFKENYTSTIGVDITKHTYKLSDKTIVNFIIWDVAGQSDFLTYRKNFYNGAHCAIIVLDRTREETLKNVKKWYNDITNSLEEKLPMVIVGNKSDLLDNIVVQEKDIKAVADELGFNYILTSAKTGENVHDAFAYMASKVLERL
ncbi:MAG: GTP-binding protein [Candidatus Lokiarchaeota archaeon]|nr:GTP-binding protein [Candidatus Lokiarchaeota archaeon]